MAHGGARTGAGRKAGSTTTKTREIADGAVASGQSPLEYMLNVMRDPGADEKRRDEMAKSAAPYIHPRLSSVQADVDVGVQDSLAKLMRDIDGRSRGLPG